MKLQEGGDQEIRIEDLGEPSVDVSRPVQGPRFDPSPGREQVRAGLAIGAFLLFCLLVLLIAGAVVFGFRSWQEVQGLCTSVVPVVVSVVGTITGFYFGSKAGDK